MSSAARRRTRHAELNETGEIGLAPSGGDLAPPRYEVCPGETVLEGNRGHRSLADVVAQLYAYLTELPLHGSGWGWPSMRSCTT